METIARARLETNPIREIQIRERTVRRLQKKKFQWRNYVLSGSTVLGIGLLAAVCIYGARAGVFTSQETFSAFIKELGWAGPIVFLLIQAVQVVIPILPGAIGCAVGVVAYGPVFGFLLNYIGISIGSIIAFLLAKRYGVGLVKRMVQESAYEKYASWLEQGNRFDRMFAIAIFAPVAPDDLLCFLAGLTKMSVKKFICIILMLKPFSIALYSIGLTSIISFIFH